MSKFVPISHFLSLVSCDSLVLQGLRCEWGAGVLNLVLSLSLSHTGHWKFNMAPHGKELSEDLKKRIVALHKDGVGQGCQTQGPRAYSGPPHHFMWPARAYDYRIKKTKQKKNLATLYRTLWKCVSIPQVSVSIWRSTYTQKLTLVCINKKNTQWFFHWWWLRGRLKGIKRTSSISHILHSFNELKKSMDAFRHDFLLLFLRSYFNDKCPERIIACKSASNARAQTSPLAGEFPFIHSHRKRTRSLSVRHYMCALKNDLLSWI